MALNHHGLWVINNVHSIAAAGEAAREHVRPLPGAAGQGIAQRAGGLLSRHYI